MSAYTNQIYPLPHNELMTGFIQNTISTLQESDNNKINTIQ